MKLPFFRAGQSDTPAFDPARCTPVIRCSICTGEQVAGFRENATGKIHDVALIRGEQDLQAFRKQYGITGPIEKVY